MPLLLNQYNLQKNVKYQLIIFTNLLEFVKTYIVLFELTDLNEAEQEILLEIPVLCLQTLQHSDPSIKLAGVKNIPSIVTTWPQNLREAFYLTFKKNLAQPEIEGVRKEILDCFNKISDQFPQEIIDHIILKEEAFDGNELKFYLDSLKVLAPKQQFTEIVLKQIVSECQNHSLIGYSTLYNLLKINFDRSELFITLHNNFSIIQKIFNYNTQSSIELLKFQSGISSMVIQKLDVSEQNKIVSDYVLPLIDSLGNENGDEVVKNILILEGFVINLRSEVQISKKYEMLKLLLGYIGQLDVATFDFVCHIFANVINKTQEGNKVV